MRTAIGIRICAPIALLLLVLLQDDVLLYYNHQHEAKNSRLVDVMQASSGGGGGGGSPGRRQARPCVQRALPHGRRRLQCGSRLLFLPAMRMRRPT